ncbi:MAG: hypothetical protein IT330_07140 [Anaerolineae bacterium]|nr:hypothetical protein [Anaerolineae bacterium]
MPENSLEATRRRIAERILEDERLYSNLEDHEAKVLTEWAMAQLDAPIAAKGKAAETALEERGRRVRQALRDINDLVGERGRLSAEEREARLRTILSRGNATTAAWSGSAEWEEARRLLRDWDHLSNLELIHRLLDLVTRTWRETRRATQGNPKRSSGTQGCLMAILVVFLLLTLGIAGFYALTQIAGKAIRGLPAEPTPTVAAGETPAASSWYRVYFTSPKYPDDPRDHRGGLDERLVEFLKRAQQSIDVAIYDLDLSNVADTLIAAKNQGVTVRIVTDTDNLKTQAIVRLQRAGITVIDDKREAIMHNKFAVVDGLAVWTGSWNFTENDTYRYNNNAIEIDSPELARNYRTKFEQMFRDKEFGPGRPTTRTTRFTIGGITVENYFSPEDKIASRIATRLSQAQQSIYFMAFSFTDDDIGQVVLDRARAGVTVQGVFETTGSETRFSEYTAMRGAKLDVRQDGNPFLMHHKVFIVDGRTVIFGSYNFSRNADEDNDENLLIVDDPALAEQFLTEFRRVYLRASTEGQ